jgi:hypothetical protein
MVKYRPLFQAGRHRGPAPWSIALSCDAMVDRRCLNCDGALTELSVFCPRCAQRTDTGRLSFEDVARDAFQTFVNVERGPLAFAWALLTRPGAVAREYVEGKRRRHFGPFATLLALVGLAALAINVSGFQVLSHDGLTTRPTESPATSFQPAVAGTGAAAGHVVPAGLSKRASASAGAHGAERLYNGGSRDLSSLGGAAQHGDLQPTGDGACLRVLARVVRISPLLNSEWVALSHIEHRNEELR